ncbi:MAG: helix-turn-helix domain-containing protein [Oscillospiraceae bacterium]|nr:helix-turn-helix domain-containing protein [Oscillospiraceae bacterium]
MTDFDKYVDEQLENPEFRREYEALDPEFAIIDAMIDARISSGLTQKQISERSGIAQGDISKLENGNGNPSLKTLKRLANAMNMKLKVEFTPYDDSINKLIVAEPEHSYKK